jgi:hypothetical protein
VIGRGQPFFRLQENELRFQSEHSKRAAPSDGSGLSDQSIFPLLANGGEYV